MKALLREVVKEVLEGEMTEPLGAAPRGSAQKQARLAARRFQPAFGEGHG